MRLLVGALGSKKLDCKFLAPLQAEPLAAQFETDQRSAAALQAMRPQRFPMRLLDATARLFSPSL